MDTWRDEVAALIECARKALEHSVRSPVQLADVHQHNAIVALMEAVEIHNDNYRFKVTNDGKTMEHETEESDGGLLEEATPPGRVDNE